MSRFLLKAVVFLGGIAALLSGCGPKAPKQSRAGFRSIEHLGPGDTIWTACSTQEVALLADALLHPAMKAPPFKIPAFVQIFMARRMQKLLINPVAFEAPADATRLQHAFDTYSAEKCLALSALFVADHTWNVPTLVRLKTQELADSEEYQRDPYLPFIPEESVKEWREVTDKFRKLPPAMHATLREAYRRQLALTKLFSEAGRIGSTGGRHSGRISFRRPLGVTLRRSRTALRSFGFSASGRV